MAVVPASLLVFIGFCFLNQSHSNPTGSGNAQADGEQWGYVTVRDNAHMFWWLYDYPGSAAADGPAPLILWLQGGPGGSGTGFGNFMEIGPLDINLKPRNTTWLKKASLLFVDSPVGTGYSYVTDDNAYATGVDQVGIDLVTLLVRVYKEVPSLQNAPLYVFGESYGGKVAVVFGLYLWNAIQDGRLKADFRGVALGDSWIHPELIVHSWGEYLYSTSLVDQKGLFAIDESAFNISQAIAAKNWMGAAQLFFTSLAVVTDVTHGVDWYNILNPLGERLYQQYVAPLQADPLDVLMNGPIRAKLGIIPDNVTWGGQADQVSLHLLEEFMMPVTDAVDNLLNNPKLKVVVYNAQLDLLCSSIGVEAWVQNLQWDGLSQFNAAVRRPVTLPDASDYIVGFVKSYDQFSFYWMLRAGHMLPIDQDTSAGQVLVLVRIRHLWLYSTHVGRLGFSSRREAGGSPSPTSMTERTLSNVDDFAHCREANAVIFETETRRTMLSSSTPTPGHSDSVRSLFGCLGPRYS